MSKTFAELEKERFQAIVDRKERNKGIFKDDNLKKVKDALEAARNADIVEDTKNAEGERLFGESFISYSGPHHVVFFDGEQTMADGKVNPNFQKYYTVATALATGKQTRTYFDDNYFDKTYLRDKDCFGSFANLHGTDCVNWAEALLKGDDTKFLAQLQPNHENFFNVAKSNIEKMHPVMALQILRRFGFRKHRHYDEKAGTDLFKVESVSHWVKYITQTHSKKEINDMLTNKAADNLKTYLNLVSQYVNCNPGILNKNYSGPSDEQFGNFKVPEDAARYGLKAPTPYKRGNLYALGAMGMNQHIFSMGSGLYSPAMHSMFGGQSGGGNGVPLMLSPFGTPTFTPGLSLLRENNDKPMCKAIKFHLENQGYDVITSVYRGIIENFKNKGKTFPTANQNELEKMIRNYKTIQDELVKTLCYLEEYTKAMDFTTQPGSLATMRKLGERLSKIYGKQNFMERNLLSNLMRLALADEDGSDYQKI